MSALFVSSWLVRPPRCCAAHDCEKLVKVLKANHVSKCGSLSCFEMMSCFSKRVVLWLVFYHVLFCAQLINFFLHSVKAAENC